MFKVVGKHDVSRRAFWELCGTKSDEIRGVTYLYCTFCQFFGGDIVKLFNFFHDQLFLVDLDHQRSIPFVPSEPELTNRVLQFLRDVHRVGLA